MIAAAGLLVLLGLGLFIAGIRTGIEPFYWACVAACVAAAVLTAFVRRSMSSATSSATSAETTGSAEPAGGSAPRGRPTEQPAQQPVAQNLPDPAIEEVEVTDLLLVVDLKDEVLVVDEHPRYHLAGCAYLSGRTTISLPVGEARGDGFTPCAACEPDRNLAERARARRKAARGT